MAFVIDDQKINDLNIQFGCLMCKKSTKRDNNTMVTMVSLLTEFVDIAGSTKELSLSLSLSNDRIIELKKSKIRLSDLIKFWNSRIGRQH